MPAHSVTKPTLTIALLLLAFMAATRFHHFGSAMHLPDASLAIFFLAGWSLRRAGFFVVLFAAAVLIDYLAITYAGVSDRSISPAYGFLLPTYGCSWLAGRWYTTRHQHRWSTLAPLLMALTVGTTLAFVISNGSFYLLSGRFPDIGWIAYSARVAQYFPPYATSTVTYVLLVVGLHAAITSMTSSTMKRAVNHGERP